MKTYTIKEILDNPKIIIFIENKEQFDRLSNIKELKLTDYYMGSYCYDPHDKNWSSSSTKTYPGAYDSDSIIITFEQIIENLTVLCRSRHLSHHRKEKDVVPNNLPPAGNPYGRRGKKPLIQCIVDGCENWQHGKSLCKKHYEYRRRKGLL